MDYVEHTEKTAISPDSDARLRVYQRFALLEDEVVHRLPTARRLLILLAALRVGLVGVVCVVGIVPHVGDWVIGPVVGTYVIVEVLAYADRMWNHPQVGRRFWSSLYGDIYYLIRRIFSRDRT